MQGIARGLELNIYESDSIIENIKNPDDLFNAVKEVVNNFNDNRECFPADLEFEDDKHNKIEYQQDTTLNFINPTLGTITIVHHFSFTDATYKFEYFDNKNPIKTKCMRFQGMNVIEADSSNAFKKGNECFYLDLQGTGDAPIEETILFWIDKNGINHSTAIEHYVSDELDDDQEADLREFTDKCYIQIFNN